MNWNQEEENHIVKNQIILKQDIFTAKSGIYKSILACWCCYYCCCAFTLFTIQMFDFLIFRNVWHGIHKYFSLMSINRTSTLDQLCHCTFSFLVLYSLLRYVCCVHVIYKYQYEMKRIFFFANNNIHTHTRLWANSRKFCRSEKLFWNIFNSINFENGSFLLQFIWIIESQQTPRLK